jgi:hypothetical protein
MASVPFPCQIEKEMAIEKEKDKNKTKIKHLDKGKTKARQIENKDKIAWYPCLAVSLSLSLAVVCLVTHLFPLFFWFCLPVGLSASV